MALSNKSDIETELQHAMMLSDEAKTALEAVVKVADASDEDDLERMQNILKMLVDSEYTQPDLL
jgi:hypothetical protein